MDIIERIDDAITPRCGACGGRLRADGPSRYYCDEDCQQLAAERRARELDNAIGRPFAETRASRQAHRMEVGVYADGAPAVMWLDDEARRLLGQPRSTRRDLRGAFERMADSGAYMRDALSRLTPRSQMSRFGERSAEELMSETYCRCMANGLRYEGLRPMLVTEEEARSIRGRLLQSGMSPERIEANTVDGARLNGTPMHEFDERRRRVFGEVAESCIGWRDAEFVRLWPEGVLTEQERHDLELFDDAGLIRPLRVVSDGGLVLISGDGCAAYERYCTEGI